MVTVESPQHQKHHSLVAKFVPTINNTVHPQELCYLNRHKNTTLPQSYTSKYYLTINFSKFEVYSQSGCSSTLFQAILVHLQNLMISINCLISQTEHPTLHSLEYARSGNSKRLYAEIFKYLYLRWLKIKLSTKSILNP